MKDSLEARMLIDFSRASEIARWSAANDVVMGGTSTGGLLATANGTALFTGTVSFEGGGGFASVRSDNAVHDLHGSRALIVRVRGDGKRYQLRLRTTDERNGISYLAPFETERERWLDVSLSSEAFQPSWRGHVIATIPALEFEVVHSLGFLIADRQAGDFALEIAWIAKG